MSISFMMRNNSVQALDRGLTILDLLANTGGELGVTEVPRQLGVNKSTAYRLLATLQRHDLVDQNPDTEKYRLGHGLVRLAGSVTAAMDLVKASGPGLRDLASATEETVNLAILQGDRVYEGHPTCQAVVSLQFSAAGGQDPPVWQRSASDGEGEGK
jgi:DNA-binding IclR family transcriptional regulator